MKTLSCRMLLTALTLLVTLPLLAPPAAAHPAAGVTSQAATSQAVASQAVTSTLKPGMRGPEVAMLQRRLLELGYWHPGVDSHYGEGTRQAVIALQKVAGIGRDGVTGPATRRALDAGVRPTARSRSGHVLELDKARQVLLVVDGGRVSHVFATSTGSGKTYYDRGRRKVASTPAGKFRIDRQVNGIRKAPLGNLYRPKYFNGGIAFHGYSSVPAYPASHGCARLTNRAMDFVWSRNLAPVGTSVWVY